MKKLIVIPDAHAHPDYDNDRFTWAGKFIADEGPSHVVCIGDFADMPSLSSYDKGSKSFEGRRYKRDIEATLDAQEKLFAPLQKRDSKRSIANRPNTQWYMTVGNHDSNRGRFGKAIRTSPELEGVVDDSQLEYKRRWHVTDFKSTLELDGVLFSHYFTSGVRGEAISGENIGLSLLRKTLRSTVQGHSHVLDKCVRSTPDGTKMFGLSVGCFTHPDFVEGWNADTVAKWWRGLIVMENVQNGTYETYREVPMSWLKREYGG